jgi:mRNA-degrading endonuclease RelE of RelBE toxin-antitoxin system
VGNELNVLLALRFSPFPLLRSLHQPQHILREEVKHLPYSMVYAPETRDHLRYLTARQRSTVFDEVNQQLTHEPTVETRNRKPLRPNPLASWELRIGNLRVYYDVEEVPEPRVDIVAIGMKRRSRVSIGGELYDT